MVICMGGGSQAHEEEERNSCIHFPGAERVTQIEMAEYNPKLIWLSVELPRLL